MSLPALVPRLASLWLECSGGSATASRDKVTAAALSRSEGGELCARSAAESPGLLDMLLRLCQGVEEYLH